MTREMLLIAAVRLGTALPVLRWPLAGALIAIAGDLSDLFLMAWIDAGGVHGYQHFDKVLDLTYMATFIIVALRWGGLARSVAVALFGMRMVGVAAFELTGWRPMLMALPNVFEFWFVFVALWLHRLPVAPIPGRVAWPALAAVAAAKLGQEYVLHGWRWLDNYTLPEFLELVRGWVGGLFR